MKSVRRFVPVLAGLLTATGAWGVSTAGCSSNGGSAGGGNPDATTDAESDVAAEGEADSGTGGDGQVADTFVGGDTFVQSDTGSPADTSAPGDTGADAFDGSAALAFTYTESAALCNLIANCCGTTGDASTFNWATCTYDEQQGFAGANVGSQYVVNGNVIYNASAGQACLTAINQIDCTTNQLTSAVATEIYQSCFAVYTGTLAAGAPCFGTIECAPGNICIPADAGVVDGGPIGSCQALRSDGGLCGVEGSNLAQDMCSYRGSGGNGFSCQEWTPGSPTTPLAPGAWFCAPQTPSGSACSNNLNCSTFECGSTHQCVNTQVAVGSGACTAFTIVDAGGGG